MKRKGLMYEKDLPVQVRYVVRIVEDGSEEPDFDGISREEYSVRLDKRKKSEKKLVIYRML